MIKIDGGKTPVDLDGTIFHIDLVAWCCWYCEQEKNADGDPFKVVKLAVDKAKAENDVDLTMTAADALLAGVVRHYQEVKKKQSPALTSPPATG